MNNLNFSDKVLRLSVCLLFLFSATYTAHAQVLKNNDTAMIIVNTPQRNGTVISDYLGSVKGQHETTILRFASGYSMMGFRYDDGKWGIIGGNPEIVAGMYVNGGGKLPGVASLEFPNGFYVGKGKAQRRMGFLSGPPSPDNRVGAYDNLYMKGDVVFDADMVDGKNGWRCLQTGGWGVLWSNFSRDAIYVGFGVVPDISNGYIYRVIDITNDPNLTTNPQWTTTIGSKFKHGRLILECYGIDYRGKNFAQIFKTF